MKTGLTRSNLRQRWLTVNHRLMLNCLPCAYCHCFWPLCCGLSAALNGQASTLQEAERARSTPSSRSAPLRSHGEVPTMLSSFSLWSPLPACLPAREPPSCSPAMLSCDCLDQKWLVGIIGSRKVSHISHIKFSNSHVKKKKVKGNG